MYKIWLKFIQKFPSYAGTYAYMQVHCKGVIKQLMMLHPFKVIDLIACYVEIVSGSWKSEVVFTVSVMHDFLTVTLSIVLSAKETHEMLKIRV